MTQVEVADALGDEAEPLPGVWQYGPTYAVRAVRAAPFAGLEFLAILQHDRDTDRLVQVLLERRQNAARPRDFVTLLTALEDLYGPAALCAVPNPDGSAVPLSLRARWDYPSTTIHAVFTDFLTTGVLFEDSGARDLPVVDRLADRLELRTFTRRSFPRQVAVRWHDRAATHLLPRDVCRPLGDP